MIKAALFDLDGVVFDTESQYSIFWGMIGREYHPEMPDFEYRIKGQTLVQIYDKYFTDEAVFQPYTVLRFHTEKGCTFQIAVWMRLALGEILAGQHTVEISLEFRVTVIDIQHLLNVAARYHSAFYAMLLQVADEVFEPCNIFILHGLFKLIQSGCNLSLFLLCACKTFDVGEDGFIGEILVVNMTVQSFTYTCTTYCNAKGVYSASWR